MVRLDIGGGSRPREGFTNVDLLPCADIRLNLETDRLPFEDGTVDEVYSSHCLEHVRNVPHVLREIVRVCRVGATVEIRVPHPFSDMAICPGHIHAIGETQMRHWCVEFVADWFPGPKRLELRDTELVPSAFFARARELHPENWTDDDIKRYVPGTCHELRFHLTVIPHDV